MPGSHLAAPPGGIELPPTSAAPAAGLRLAAGLPRGVTDVAQCILDHGYTCYLVGGAVRDMIVGKQPRDYDLVTDADERQLQVLFRESAICGVRHRFVVVKKDRLYIEISSFVPSEVHPGRGGTRVQDWLVRDSLARDVTFNAIYMELCSGAIVDMVGGKADLATRTVRPIGNLRQRSAENPLLVLRTVRFASRPGYRLAAGTVALLATAHSWFLPTYGVESMHELFRLLTCGHALAYADNLRNFRLLDRIAPTMAEDEQWPSFRHALAYLDAMKHRYRLSPVLAFAIFLWPARPHVALAGLTRAQFRPVAHSVFARHPELGALLTNLHDPIMAIWFFSTVRPGLAEDPVLQGQVEEFTRYLRWRDPPAPATHTQ